MTSSARRTGARRRKMINNVVRESGKAAENVKRELGKVVPRIKIKRIKVKLW